MKDLILNFIKRNENKLLKLALDEGISYVTTLTEKELYKYLYSNKFMDYIKNKTNIVEKLEKILNISDLSNILIDFYEYEYDEIFIDEE